eukprot:2849663-Rhodomonas_salina.1
MSVLFVQGTTSTSSSTTRLESDALALARADSELRPSTAVGIPMKVPRVCCGSEYDFRVETAHAMHKGFLARSSLGISNHS